MNQESDLCSKKQPPDSRNEPGSQAAVLQKKAILHPNCLLLYPWLTRDPESAGRIFQESEEAGDNHILYIRFINHIFINQILYATAAASSVALLAWPASVASPMT